MLGLRTWQYEGEMAVGSLSLGLVFREVLWLCLDVPQSFTGS